MLCTIGTAFVKSLRSMSVFVWFLVLVVLGLVTRRVVGALTAFTRGPVLSDLLAGGLGALIGGGLPRWLGPLGFRAPLPTLLIGIGIAFRATWLTPARAQS
jgi:hypothetical protein